jgi:hypothetical protein
MATIQKQPAQQHDTPAATLLAATQRRLQRTQRRPQRQRVDCIAPEWKPNRLALWALDHPGQTFNLKRQSLD